MFDYSKITDLIANYLLEEEEEADISFRGGASEDQIDAAEELLGIHFPKSYKWFLANYGSGGIAGIDIFGIERKQRNLLACTLIYATNYYRERIQLDSRYIVIENCGDYITCLDSKDLGEGEFSVVMYMTHGEEGIYKKQKSFYDFFLDKLIYMTE